MKVSKVSRFQTSDGLHFLTKKEAERHQAYLDLVAALEEIAADPDCPPLHADLVADAMLRRGGWRVVNALSAALRRASEPPAQPVPMVAQA